MSIALVIDDNELILEPLLDVFAKLNIATIVCSDPATAIEWLKKNRFDFVLCDYHMPILGKDLVRLVKNQYPGTSVAIMSGDVQALDKSLMPDADCFLIKGQDNFIGRLREWVGRVRLRRRFH